MEILYTILIYPLELLMQIILEFGFQYTHSYGLSIILLSVCINIFAIPLNLLAEKWAYHEKLVQHGMSDEIAQIKKAFKGQEKYMMLRTLYRQYEYHPIFALRASFGLFLQVPFFVAAYNFLGSYSAFDNESFLFFSNLAKPDTIASFGSIQINALPIIMTAISFLTAGIYTKNSSRTEKIQSYGLAILFLILLYMSPSGLVLYWTCNNVAYLIQNIRNSRKGQGALEKHNSFTLKEMSKNKKPKRNLLATLDNIALVVPLAFLLSYFFMWSNNAHMFSMFSIAISSIIILVVAIILWFGGEIWKKISHIFFRKFPRIGNGVNAVLFAGACSLTLGIFCLAVTLQPTPIRPVLIGLWGMLFIIIFLKQVKYLNMAMFLTVSISVLRLVSALLIIDKDTTQDQSAEKEIVLEKVEFVKKPNIYLYWLESYHDFDLQESVYNIDTKPMKEYLKSHNFRVYEDVYSDAQSTLVSFVDLFTMGAIRAQTYGNLDVLSHIRKILAGDNRNLVLRQLKENGYLTQMTFLQHYLYVTNGEQLENLDVVNYKTSKYTSLQPLYSFIAGSIQSKFFIDQDGPLIEQADYYMKNGLKSGKPFFLSFKGGAVHTPDVGYSYKDSDRWTAPTGYPSYVKSSNEEAKKIIDNIIKNDPNSIIILIGDHGSWRLRGAWKGKNLAALKQSTKEANLPFEDVVEDTFNVHLSIRLPEGKDYDLAQGHYISHVNLFTHLFAYLSENKELLTTRVPSESKFYSISVTKDGKILDE